MGARALRSMIEQPLINKEDILKRQAGIEECNNRAIDREEIREYLNPVYDLERIMTKISCKSANPRDLIAFRNSLEMLPHIKKLIGTMESDLFAECFANLDDLADIYSLISSAIVEEPPITIREAGIIKEGLQLLLHIFCLQLRTNWARYLPLSLVTCLQTIPCLQRRCLFSWQMC